MTSKSMWETVEELAKQHDIDNSTWLRLTDDGETVIIVFLGEPHPREVYFVDGRYILFTDDLKAKGLKPSLRVAFNVALYDSKEVKVLEQAIQFFKDLLQVKTQHGLDKWAFEVQRHGAANNVKTRYTIAPMHELSPDEQKEFQALPLHDLEKLYTDQGNGFAEADKGKNDGLVDPQTAQFMVTTLKRLPPQAVERFCQKFTVTRIKDLPAVRVEEAHAFIEALVQEFQAAPEHTTAIDPFA